jgi:hypothetical protein
MWKEEIDHYRVVNEAKRARVIERLIKATLSGEHRMFLHWKDWVKTAERAEKLMKMFISCLCKAANLMEYNYFTTWKL